MGRILSTMILAVLGLAYAYAAAVRALGMVGLTGLDWLSAPPRWQALDITFLALDIAVVAALVTRPVLGILLLWIAAAGQIALYTVLRDWTLDVPPAFAPDEEGRAYLDTLVRFHALSAAAAAGALWLRYRPGARHRA